MPKALASIPRTAKKVKWEQVLVRMWRKWRALGNINYGSHFRKQFGIFLKG
jgi:hypothetical protein